MEFENLLTLIKAVSDSELTEFFYEENGTNLRFVKEAPVLAESPVQVVARENAAEEKSVPKQNETKDVQGNIIKSPLVGTFYAAPAEDAAPFVTEGSEVKKGQTLGIVEAMKLMNEIESEFEGTVEEILVCLLYTSGKSIYSFRFWHR